jgi:hypothetical protein
MTPDLDVSAPCIEAPGRARTYPAKNIRLGPKRHKWVPMHRLAFERAKRLLLPGETVDHLCFNTRCIQPLHLEAVSLAENTLRAWRAGRYPMVYHRENQEQSCIRGHAPDWMANGAPGALRCRTCRKEARARASALRPKVRRVYPQRRGVGNPSARLVDAQVIEMRELRRTGWFWKDLAARYGVSVGTVRAAVARRTWNHV